MVDSLIVRIKLPRKWERHAKFEVIKATTICNVYIPVGFKTDGSSVPRWYSVIGLCLILLAQIISYDVLYAISMLVGSCLVVIPAVFPRVGVDFCAAVMHDLLIHRGETWRDANEKFYFALIDHGVPKWRAAAMWCGVTIGGLFRKLRSESKGDTHTW